MESSEEDFELLQLDLSSLLEVSPAAIEKALKNNRCLAILVYFFYTYVFFVASFLLFSCKKMLATEFSALPVSLSFALTKTFLLLLKLAYRRLDFDSYFIFSINLFVVDCVLAFLDLAAFLEVTKFLAKGLVQEDEKGKLLLAKWMLFLLATWHAVVVFVFTCVISVFLVLRDPQGRVCRKLFLTDVNGDRGEECPICLESVIDIQLLQFPCKHKFHKKCVRQWIFKNKCPVCRRELYNKWRLLRALLVVAELV